MSERRIAPQSSAPVPTEHEFEQYAAKLSRQCGKDLQVLYRHVRGRIAILVDGELRRSGLLVKMPCGMPAVLAPPQEPVIISRIGLALLPDGVLQFEPVSNLVPHLKGEVLKDDAAAARYSCAFLFGWYNAV